MLLQKTSQFWSNERSSFWRNKPVLITGASGFIGRHLALELSTIGAKIFTLGPHMVDLKLKTKQSTGTVEDFNQVNDIIKKNNIKVIFHLAAQPLVEVGQTNPLKTFEVNIQGTWNVLEAARENQVEKVIVASTVHVYGDNPKVPYKEEYFPQPSRPYETSKACADLLAQVYADTYNLPVEIPRFVNIYGPGDINFSRLIPKVIKNILEDKSPEIWDIGSIRDFLYIDDAIRAYLILAEKDLPKTKRGRVINFGTGKPVLIADVVEKILEISKQSSIKVKIETTPSDRSNEIKKQYVSIRKAKKELGWSPKISLDEGLNKTFQWYKKNLSA